MEVNGLKCPMQPEFCLYNRPDSSINNFPAHCSSKPALAIFCKNISTKDLYTLRIGLILIGKRRSVVNAPSPGSRLFSSCCSRYPIETNAVASGC